MGELRGSDPTSNFSLGLHLDGLPSAAVSLVGGVLVDQGEADADLSVTQRLGLAAGSTIQGAGGFAGDIQPLADALDVAGSVATVFVRLHSCAFCTTTFCHFCSNVIFTYNIGFSNMRCFYRWCC